MPFIHIFIERLHISRAINEPDMWQTFQNVKTSEVEHIPEV